MSEDNGRHLHSVGGQSDYYTAIGEEDRKLSDVIRAIREDERNGDLTTRDAADAKIAALEAHLAACRAARVRYLGDSD
jgi:hypothetical protein